MRPDLTACLFAAMTLIAAPTTAQRAPAGGPPDAVARPRDQPPSSTIMAEPVAVFIAACDGDGDARVTRAELAAGVVRSFASIDRDGKGSIGYIQFADWSERWLGDRNALPSPFETDTDSDNRITPAELQAQFDKTFTRLDRDKDGTLVRSEMLTLDALRGLGGPGAGRGGRQRPPRQ
ncbi:EF-hand domain-containing protein [Sphingomonas aquatica]|uniref:EF-hand domain-containing protein n=2 Tax=Sphingomonas TaxID=13687 RepID=UPI00301C3547